MVRMFKKEKNICHWVGFVHFISHIYNARTHVWTSHQKHPFWWETSVFSADIHLIWTPLGRQESSIMLYLSTILSIDFNTAKLTSSDVDIYI